MKTAYSEFGQQTAEPAAPFPNTPLTEEIIIPSVNSVDADIALRPEVYQHDDAYPLIHKMIYDLVVLRAKTSESIHYDLAAFERVARVEKHIIDHVSREIRRGYVAETPLALSSDPAEDSFTFHVARSYVKSEIVHMNQFGPDPAIIQPEYVEQSLFDSIDEVEALSETVEDTFGEQPAHISITPNTELSPKEAAELTNFNDIVKKLGGKVAQVLGVSFHSGEIPITKAMPVLHDQPDVVS